jgi:5-methylthioadenosine/S-adenosylhomocysteine deaminase
MATNGGASLGRPGQLGRVAVGQLADLVLVDTTGLHHPGTDHPVPALALYGRAADVTTVIVDGRIIIEHGELRSEWLVGLLAARPTGACHDRSAQCR